MATAHGWRSKVGLVGVLAVVVLAGCSSVPFLDEGSSKCGPGEDEIGALRNGQEVNVTGELQSLEATRAVIDDGTGTAELIGSFDTNRGTTGDCVSAVGVATTGNVSEYDAQIVIVDAGGQT